LAYEIKNVCSIDFGTVYETSMEYDALRIKELHQYMHNFLWFTESTMLFSITTDNYNFFCVLSLDKTNSNDYLTIQYVVF